MRRSRLADPAHTAGPDFEVFALQEGQQLRRVLIAHFGVEVGTEVTADAMAYAWEHWDKVQAMANPLGYLYRVAQSSARRHWRWRRRVRLPPEEESEAPLPEPGLDAALAQLRPAQRVAVLLVHALGWTYEEAARAMGIPISTIRNHLHRGMTRLRRLLGEP